MNAKEVLYILLSIVLTAIVIISAVSIAPQGITYNRMSLVFMISFIILMLNIALMFGIWRRL
jgi:hypothetical protein